MTALVRNNYKE